MTSSRLPGSLTAALFAALIVLMLAAGCTGTESTGTQGDAQTIALTDGFGRSVTA
ncbi:MAG: iron ABC transporter substrate-binding protein, partial [Methanomicrobiales archaeon]|nr:iron ABC transporter substrate-binding protein [Methanomicrobiales archaeon]